MTEKQVIKAFGEICIQLTVALSMHAENMQREKLGQSLAYGEEQFGVVIVMIEKAIKRIEHD